MEFDLSPHLDPKIKVESFSGNLIIENREASQARVELIDQFPDKAEIDASLHMAIEIIFGNQIFQRNGNVLLEVPGYVTLRKGPP